MNYEAKKDKENNGENNTEYAGLWIGLSIFGIILTFIMESSGGSEQSNNDNEQ